MYGILTFISFLLIFGVSYILYFFVGSYEVMQTVTLFSMPKGLISTVISAVRASCSAASLYPLGPVNFAIKLKKRSLIASQ
jgi:hypothetical protein